MEKNFHIKVASFIAISFFVALPCVASAATLGFSPSTITRVVGETFSVAVYVSSSDQPMNAASGVVSFPKDKLEVVSLSKASSVMNLWVQEPKFSNTNGTVNFEGIVLNPGYSGSKGNLISITFRAKSTGPASVSFSSGSVLANDGEGTNILNDLGTAEYIIGAAIDVYEEPVDIPIAEPSGNQNGISITSSTHPDQAKWYARSSPEFSWKLPNNALEVMTLIGKSPNGVPSVRYSPPISTKKVDNLPDGVYYFSLQVRTDAGWSAISRYRVNIDTTAPNPFSVTFPDGARSWQPRPVVSFITTDNESGISGYNLKVGAGDTESLTPSEAAPPYHLTVQSPGTHTVTVTAFDEAGNTRSASADFTKEAIEAPTITSYQDELESGEVLKIYGNTYPDSEVSVFIRKDEEVIIEEKTRSNSTGEFIFAIAEKIEPGVYAFTALVVDSRGAQSNETSPLTVIVKSKFLSVLTDVTLKYLSLIILIAFLLGAILVIGTYVWRHSFGVIYMVRRESREAQKVLEKSFAILRKDLRGYVIRLRSSQSRRKLTRVEMDFLKRFEEELGEAEDAIADGIDDISRS